MMSVCHFIHHSSIYLSLIIHSSCSSIGTILSHIYLIGHIHILLEDAIIIIITAITGKIYLVSLFVQLVSSFHL